MLHEGTALEVLHDLQWVQTELQKSLPPRFDPKVSLVVWMGVLGARTPSVVVLAVLYGKVQCMIDRNEA